MIISIIVAMTDKRVIGINNQLPWHLPGDMKWFRQNTLGKPVVMGRKTFESIGKPLPQRTNIIITRDQNYHVEGCITVHSIEEAISAAADADELMIIGGSSFYEQMLPQTDRLYLTLVHADIEGDAWFPVVDLNQWQEVTKEDYAADEKNPYPYSFIQLERNR
jgi:dihydrofolate reductase